MRKKSRLTPGFLGTYAKKKIFVETSSRGKEKELSGAGEFGVPGKGRWENKKDTRYRRPC